MPSTELPPTLIPCPPPVLLDDGTPSRNLVRVFLRVSRDYDTFYGFPIQLSELMDAPDQKVILFECGATKDSYALSQLDAGSPKQVVENAHRLLTFEAGVVKPKDTVWSVHTRSVMGRLLQFMQMRQLEPSLWMRELVTSRRDLCERFFQPSVITYEARSAFGPADLFQWMGPSRDSSPQSRFQTLACHLLDLANLNEKT